MFPSMLELFEVFDEHIFAVVSAAETGISQAYPKCRALGSTQLNLTHIK